MSFFKHLIYSLIGIGLGIAAGYAWHLKTAADTPESFNRDQWAQSEDASSPATTDLGELSVDEPTFEVDLRTDNAVQTHDFVFNNSTIGPVNIWCERQPEGPVSIDLDADKIAIGAGESYPVTATLTKASETFSQEFVIKTDSPDQPQIELTISGSQP